MTWLMENREILDAYRRGELAALEAVYRTYAEALRSFVTAGFCFESRGRKLRFKGLQSPLDVDDVVQEVFTRVFSEQVRLSYDGLHSFKNYLFAIARNLILADHNRLLRALASYEVEEESGAVPSGEERPPDPERLVMDQELVALTDAFVGSLSLYDRTFFDLRFRQALTQETTAQRLRATRAQVKGRERKLRQRFLKFMRGSGYFQNRPPTAGSTLPSWAAFLLGGLR